VISQDRTVGQLDTYVYLIWLVPGALFHVLSCHTR